MKKRNRRVVPDEIAAAFGDPQVNEAIAAKLLDVPIRWLQEKRRTGGGPEFLKLGFHVRYRISALRAFREKSTRTKTAPRRSSAAEPQEAKASA